MQIPAHMWSTTASTGKQSHTSLTMSLLHVSLQGTSSLIGWRLMIDIWMIARSNLEHWFDWASIYLPLTARKMLTPHRDHHRQRSARSEPHAKEHNMKSNSWEAARERPGSAVRDEERKTILPGETERWRQAVEWCQINEVHAYRVSRNGCQLAFDTETIMLTDYSSDVWLRPAQLNGREGGGSKSEIDHCNC